MEPDLRRGYLEADSPAQPFSSPLPVLAGALRIFVARIGLVAAITIAVHLPGQLLYQFAAATFDIPSNGILSFFMMELVDVVLSSLAAPAIVYGLLRSSGASQALRWGRRQWLRTLNQQVLVEITVLLYGALLIVPGIIAMLRLALVPTVVAIEADRQPHPLQRSRELTRGRLWSMLGVMLPLTLLDLGASFLLLDRLAGVDQARILFAFAETGLALLNQLSTIAAFLIYMGLVERPAAQRKTAKL